MTIETIQTKEKLCELLPDYTDQVIVDLERIVQKLGEVSTGSQACHDYHHEALEYKEILLEEGLDAIYVNSLMPIPLLETVHHLAA